MSCSGCLIGMLKSHAMPKKRQTESYTGIKKEFTATIFGKAHPSHLWRRFPIPLAHSKGTSLWALRAFSEVLGDQVGKP